MTAAAGSQESHSCRVERAPRGGRGDRGDRGDDHGHPRPRSLASERRGQCPASPELKLPPEPENVNPTDHYIDLCCVSCVSLNSDCGRLVK